MNKIKRLREFKKQSDNKLVKYVCNYILRECQNYEGDKVDGWFHDLWNGGLVGGFVSELIYYKDTHAFYKKYMEEINAILDDIKDNTGEEFSNYRGDRINTLAWLGFEETARNIEDAIGDGEE